MRRLMPKKREATPATSVPTVAHRRSEAMLPFAAITWIALVAFGLWFLMDYANRPGDQGLAEIDWPVNSLVSLSESSPTLVVFAHPKCPCTRATMSELDWLMTRCRDDVACHVLFFHAKEEDEHWGKTDCWRRASAIPGVKVLFDRESAVAKQFGIETSGHALLYDRDGRLVFEGGITPSRGHPGESPGRSKLLSLIKSGCQPHDRKPTDLASIPTGLMQDLTDRPEVDSTCVFGCPLHDPVVAARNIPDSDEG